MIFVIVASLSLFAVAAIVEAVIDARIKRLEWQIEAKKIVAACLDGHRPVVTKPPKGMTMAQAQAEIDRIWASLQFDAKPGAGGRVN